MAQRRKEIVIPIEWGGWDSHDILLTSFYEVEFYNDFGPFKAGEKYSSVSIDYQKGIVEAYNEEGTEVVKSCEWKAQII